VPEVGIEPTWGGSPRDFESIRPIRRFPSFLKILINSTT